MMIDITPFIEVLLSLVTIIVTAYLVPWIKSKTTNQQQLEINTWVKIAVQAAEQIYKGTGLGAIKKKYVTDFLASKNLTVDSDSIDKMIEAAVLELNKGVL